MTYQKQESFDLCSREHGKEITIKLKELIALTLFWSEQVEGSRANIHDSLSQIDKINVDKSTKLHSLQGNFKGNQRQQCRTIDSKCVISSRGARVQVEYKCR